MKFLSVVFVVSVPSHPPGPRPRPLQYNEEKTRRRGDGLLEGRHSETSLPEIFLNLEEEAICFPFLFGRSYFSFLASVCSVEDRIDIYFHCCVWKIMQAAK